MNGSRANEENDEGTATMLPGQGYEAEQGHGLSNTQSFRQKDLPSQARK